MADELMTQPPPKHIRLAQTSKETITEAVIFAAAFRFFSLDVGVRLIGSNEPLQLQLSLSLPPNTQTH
jgi:hypothetical protein